MFMQLFVFQLLFNLVLWCGFGFALWKIWKKVTDVEDVIQNEIDDRER